MKLLHTVVAVLGALFASFSLNAQNLVLNPSFESTTGGSCSGLISGESFSQLDHWDNANSNTPGDSCSSSDLFSPCNTIPFGAGLIKAPFLAPDNVLGYECAHTGDRYAGIITYDQAPINIPGLPASNYREYLQGKTSKPLEAGKEYCVSFYVSLADSTMYATNNLGVWFSNTHFLRDACVDGSWINKTPQLNYDCQVITHHVGWMRLQWNYVASGGEQYFTIGNFYDDNNTQVVNTGVGGMTGNPGSVPNPYAYYYIDDVSIVEGECCFAEITPPANPNCSLDDPPANNNFTFCVNDGPTDLNVELGEDCSNTGTGGTWSGPGITNATTGTFSPSVAGTGTHTVTYSLPCGANATANITVSDCDPIDVCKEQNGDLTASGGTAPFEWQNQTTTQDCSDCMMGCTLPPGCATNVTAWTTFSTGTTVTAPTTYPVRVKDATGTVLLINSANELTDCSDDPCGTITVSVDNSSDALCGGDNNGTATVSASGGNGNYTYNWTPGNLTGATQNNLGEGTYTVIATDESNCTGSTTVIISEPTAVTASATVVNDEDCGQQNGEVTVTANGGTAPYTYAWDNGDNTQNSANLSAGTYSVTVTDANDCKANASVTVSNSSGMTATATVVNDEDCGQQNGEVTVTANGGTAPYTYAWDNGDNTQNSANLSAGTYSVTITDANDCKATASVTVSNSSGMTATATVVNDEDCGQQNGEVTVTANGGTAPYTYAWDNGDNTQNSANLSAGTYSVTITDAGNCSFTDTVSIVNTPGITANIDTVNDEDCGQQNGKITVSVSGGTAPLTYAWSNGATTKDLNNLSEGNYTLTITDAKNCSATVTASIVNHDDYDLVIIADTTEGCSPLTVSFNSSIQTADYYTWDFGDGTSATEKDPIHNFYGDTCFTVSLKVGFVNGCTAEKTMTNYICPKEAPTASFIANPTTINNINSSVRFSNLSTNATSYYWDFGDGTNSSVKNPAHTFDPDVIKSQTVYLVAIHENGCKDTTEYTFQMTEEVVFYVPNAFTPDGDQYNNVFKPIFANTHDDFDYELLIFNRWGELIFESHNVNFGWDGTYEGVVTQSGTYSWKITVKKRGVAEKIEKRGHITLLK